MSQTPGYTPPAHLSHNDRDDLRSCYKMGAQQRSDAEFLEEREDWLSDPSSVRLQVNRRGPGEWWDVVLWIDGTYADKREALIVAQMFQAEIAGIMATVRARVQANPLPRNTAAEYAAPDGTP